MRKALGSSPETEHLPGTSKIGAALEGDVGLLFTDEEQTVVEEWFESYKQADFARAGNVALEGFTVPEGMLLSSRH
jgi:mRNA turnover protein 4